MRASYGRRLPPSAEMVDGRGQMGVLMPKLRYLSFVSFSSAREVGTYEGL